LFELYTEQARRVIFFAHRWAERTDSAYIGTTHLLLGLTHDRQSKAEKLFHLREHRDIFKRSLHGKAAHRDKSFAPGEIPLDLDCRYALGFAAEEATRLNSPVIDTHHIVLGILRQEKCSGANLLVEAGINLSSARQLADGTSPINPPAATVRSSLLRTFYRKNPPNTSSQSNLSRMFYLFALAAVIIAIYFIVRIALGG
jgi:ATP-dependent Clp protease ATP-binding subunit ClpC